MEIRTKHMFDVDPFTESTIEDRLDYIEIELLGDKDPFTLFIAKRASETSKRITKELSDMDTLATLYRMWR